MSNLDTHLKALAQYVTALTTDGSLVDYSRLQRHNRTFSGQ